MDKFDIVVVGGSAAGIPAAITARRHYPEKTVMIIRKEEQVLIPCGIPYIFGSLGDCSKNLIPDAVLEKNGIELVVDEVTGVHPDRKTVTTAGGKEIGYSRLVLAMGPAPWCRLSPAVTRRAYSLFGRMLPTWTRCTRLWTAPRVC